MFISGVKMDLNNSGSNQPLVVFKGTATFDTSYQIRELKVEV